MSSSSSTTFSFALTDSVVVCRGFGRVGVGRREIREAARRRLRRMVDAIADGRPVAGVDELREERVHHVVVQSPSPTGLVGLAAAGGEFDLEKSTLLGV